jgi:NodT family efflux transporter outer membrane factor (OMF) lipoprotein
MIRSTVVSVLAAVSLAACVTPPQYPVTDIQVAAAYGLGNSAKNEPRVRLSANTVSATEALGTPWWQQFGDERLNRLIAKVLEANTDLAVAGLRLKQARLTAGLASDALRPHVDATVSSGYSKLLEAGSSGTHNNSASVGVSYALDLWGKLRSQREAATWEAQATAEDLQSTALLLVGDTCDLYWTLAFLNQRVVAGEQSLDRLQRTLTLVQDQFNAGAVSRLEVREAEQNVESQRAAQSQLIQQRIETRNALTVLLDGHPWPELDELQSLNDTHSPAIESGVPADLLARRPDLRAAELRLRAALASVHATAASYYPAISLTGDVGGSSTALGDVLANPVATLGAGLALPFLHWNEMKLNTEIAGTDYEIAATDFRKTLYTAFTDVDNALSARVELNKQLDARQKSFDAAVDVERLYEVRYRSGATPLRLWLDAQETRRSAELSLAEARLAQLQNDALLFQALGGGA